MNVHLIDGTYELFRHFFALPSATDKGGQEISAARGVAVSVLSMIEGGATHLGVATDHVVESFRNDLYPGYKTSEGVAAELLSQFPCHSRYCASIETADRCHRSLAGGRAGYRSPVLPAAREATGNGRR